MFLILSKTIGLLTKPLTWLMILISIAVFGRKPQLKKMALIAALIVLLIFTNPFFINFTLKLWEPAPVSIKGLPNYDIGILLGGFSRHLYEADNLQLTDSGDRLWQTVSLYKQEKIKKILVSGGSTKTAKPEAAAVYDALLAFGIPDTVIFVEDKSRNTRENAVFTAELIAKHHPDAKCLLITSAVHMKRSLGCFRKAGLNPDPFPADHIARYYKTYWAEWIRPEPAAFRNWDRVVNEWVGIIVYKIQRYI